MYEDDNQIIVPPSFLALYSDARGRLTVGAGAVRTRYELCEDLAGHLTEQARLLYHTQVPSEGEILQRMHAGLAAGPEAAVSAAEARWITLRLAELLGWPSPELPEITPP
ncbi:hypothetical protein C6568_02790 [Melaminivora suipulveris]|uniref:ATPase with chaperone activity n=1 Tax=Melaminivora suipulveris TaxID=2109913 RepID=A0A2R3Q9E4_9BURK|nr:hypothetical protein [Melaminivora suipulveris]AVO48294.1 hypothetical protein C6568_02790 [Melaminivora suipulveris]